MIDKIFDINNMGLSPYSAKFKNAALERAYNEAEIPFFKEEARAGVIIAALGWLIFFFIEPTIAPTSARASIWLTTLAAMSFLAIVYRATYLSIFNQFHQAIILLGVLTTMGIVVFKIKFYPDFSIMHYMPTVMCITIWLFSISGLTFTSSVLVSLIFYILVYSVFLATDGISTLDVTKSIYYMLISYFMGALISIHQEIQSRKIFLAHKALEEEKHHHHHKSLHDTLTKLPNRELLEDRLSQAIHLSVRNETKSAGLYIDLDKFKSINDQHGHLVGDLYLLEVVNRLRYMTRDTDTLARLGGDEFFLILQDIKDEEAALDFARKIKSNLNEHFILADKLTIKGLGASVGICMLPYAGCTPQDIINRADKAMYQVKHLGKNDLTLA